MTTIVLNFGTTAHYLSGILLPGVYNAQSRALREEKIPFLSSPRKCDSLVAFSVKWSRGWKLSEKVRLSSGFLRKMVPRLARPHPPFSSGLLSDSSKRKTDEIPTIDTLSKLKNQWRKGTLISRFVS